MAPRLPWDIIETLPTTDAEILAEWEHHVRVAGDDPAERCTALVGRALSRYWAVQEGVTDLDRTQCSAHRQQDVAAAAEIARTSGDDDLIATALLGRLYALWSPDAALRRAPVVLELVELLPRVRDTELRLRIREWVVLGHLDLGDRVGAEREIARFRVEAAAAGLQAFERRVELWHANLELCRGQIDQAVDANRTAISTTAAVAGSPFSFQNVAITLAIERFLRRGLADLIDALRSILASSPRVAPNWETGLAFALAETGQLDEAQLLFEALALDDFERVPRDLNWLVTMQLLALVALHLDDRPRITQLAETLEPFGHLDAVHGSGYASYGPVGRVLGSLHARLGHHEVAAGHFADVLGSRTPGPWTSLARLDRARSISDLDPGGAFADSIVAERELIAFEMADWAARARTLRHRLQLDGHGRPIVMRTGDEWQLRHPRGTARVRHGVGVAQLVELLSRPGVELDAVVLDGDIEAGLPRTASGWETLDPAARQSYRRRLAELSERPGTEAADEADLLRRELAGASMVSSNEPELERARVRVTKTLRRTIDAIAEDSGGLGAHLASAIRTGRRCQYLPPDGTGWDVVRDESSGRRLR